MCHRRYLLATVLVTVILFSTGTARGDLIALTFTGGVNTSLANPPGTVGWSFTINQPIVITQLGYFDASPANPLGTAHPVGIWTDDGSLVASATVLPNSPVTAGFRYASSFPTPLDPGSYVIGAFIPPPPTNDNLFVSGLTTPVVITTLPEITFVNALLTTGPALTQPTTVVAGGGRFGPNFQFLPVPEPGTWALFGLGLALLTGAWWRQRVPA